jgi:hypothetical protein
MATGLGKVIRDRAVQLRDALSGGGIPTSLEAAQVQLPGAWVTFVSATPETMSGYRLRFHVYLIAPETGSSLATMDTLGELLPKALDVIEPDEDITAMTVTLPTAPATPMPAMRLVVDELADINED